MHAQMIRIRTAQPEDHKVILLINQQSWTASYGHIYTQAEMQALFNNMTHQRGSWVDHRIRHIKTLVAEIDQRIVGFIGIGFTILAGRGEVTTLYLHPDYQGQGIGKQLWQEGLKQLRENECSGVWVWVLEKADARHFYEAQGCTIRSTGIYHVGEHAETALGYWMAL